MLIYEVKKPPKVSNYKEERAQPVLLPVLYRAERCGGSDGANEPTNKEISYPTTPDIRRQCTVLSSARFICKNLCVCGGGLPDHIETRCVPQLAENTA